MARVPKREGSVLCTWPGTPKRERAYNVRTGIPRGCFKKRTSLSLEKDFKRGSLGPGMPKNGTGITIPKVGRQEKVGIPKRES